MNWLKLFNHNRKFQCGYDTFIVCEELMNNFKCSQMQYYEINKNEKNNTIDNQTRIQE